MRRRSLVIALLGLALAAAPLVSAQRTGATGSIPQHFGPTGFAPRASFSHFSRVADPRPSLYPFAFYDPFYADYVSGTGYPVASQPPVIILQAPPAAAPISEASSAPAQPLMIELRGDRYVQVSGAQNSDSEVIDRGTAQLSRQPWSPDNPRAAAASSEPVTAILVFRDGHREEVSGYTIADGILYARADYYTDGTWNRRIPLSSLNLAETVNANSSRGIRFQLPTAPNEVIVSQ